MAWRRSRQASGMAIHIIGRREALTYEALSTQVLRVSTYPWAVASEALAERLRVPQQAYLEAASLQAARAGSICAQMVGGGQARRRVIGCTEHLAWAN